MFFRFLFSEVFNFVFLFLDALHSYFGVCGLALMDEPGLRTVYAPLNISQRAADYLHRLHMTSLS